MIPQLFQAKEDCCGCKACANVCSQDAISFASDEYGFEYPTIDPDKCIGCQQCVKTCDFQKEVVSGHKPLEGLAARHKEKTIYENSTSGGMFTAIAEWVLAQGGVVYGCVYDNMRTVHKMAENMEQLAAIRGSKYVQSDLGFIYREVKDKLKEGRNVFFTGTPCQVAGLYSFLRNTDHKNLLTADIVCHGVSSPGMFRKYIGYLEEKHHRKIINFTFRDKRLFGWERPVISVRFADGGEKWWFSTIDMYAENYYHSNLFRISCLHCKYACDIRMGDFTICDFWGYKNSNLLMSTIEGVSACLLNTKKAKQIVDYLKINSEAVKPDIIIAGNNQLRQPSTKGKDWDIVMNTIKNEGFRKLLPIFRKTHLKAYIKAPVKRLLLRPMK